MGKSLVLSRTPLRVSFAGGGTDLPAVCRSKGGAVCGSAIDKYVYVVVKPASPRLASGAGDAAYLACERKNPIVRAALKEVGIANVDVMTFSDIPQGTGLGFSGSLAVGLWNALHAFAGRSLSPRAMAQGGYHLETSCGALCGKQDQYFAAYGGVRFFQFSPNDTVEADLISLDKKKRSLLQESLLLVFSGRTRPSQPILKELNRAARSRANDLCEMRRLAGELRRFLRKGITLTVLGRILNEDWALKRSLVPGITDPEMDVIYEAGMAAGALGGKVLGAGGGGFLLFCVPPRFRKHFKEAMSGFQILDFAIEDSGSRVWRID